MRHFPFFALLLTQLLLPLSAQDAEKQFIQLQSSYTQRLQELLSRHQSTRRDLLNKYILALVRIEQNYRDDADLDAVVYCRDLREQLLTGTGEFPGEPRDAPAGVSDLYRSLEQKDEELRRTFQTELNQLNQILYQALEPYQQEFTRQGLIDQAVEIQSLRQVLSKVLSEARSETQARVSIPSTLSTDPNVLPFCIEGAGYGRIRGIIPRTSMTGLRFVTDGLVDEIPLGYSFVNGALRLTANQTGPLMEDLARNRLLTVEVAFKPEFNLQGEVGNPALLFMLGEHPDRALLALTMEGNQLFLYLKTDLPPPGRENHRYEISRLRDTRPVHVLATYRQGELTVYVNGTASLTLRNEIKGTLNGWQPTEMVLGKCLPNPENRFIFPFRGNLHHLYLKAGDTTSRQAVANYNRYLLLFQE